MGSLSITIDHFIHGHVIWLLVISYICVGVVGVEYYTEKPAYILPCKIYESGFSKCSTKSIQGLIDQWAIGIPEVTESFGRVDPMKLDKVVFKQDNNEAATIRANLTDLIVKGFAGLQVKESRVNKKDFSWETKLFMPKLRLDGNYKMDGRVLLLPLSGNGKFYIEIDNLDILMYTKTRLYEKGGFTFYNVTQVNVDLALKALKTNFDNLFNGKSKEVERSTNEFFNENWRDFFEALRPLINRTVERILINLMQSTFHLIPANFFVEDIPTSKQLYGAQSE